MTRGEPRLTKTRYVDGLRCARKLWLSHYEPLPHEAVEPFSTMDVGVRIGREARKLFPSGELIANPPWEHSVAVARTAELMANPGVPAIFEAAFEAGGVRIRVDVLERLAADAWDIREVKASASVDESKGHLDDVAVQLKILQECGVEVRSVELVHVDTGYVREGGDIALSAFFHRADITGEAFARQAETAERISDFLGLLSETDEPDVRPSKQRCRSGFVCPYWGRCTGPKPEYWVASLPNLRSQRVEELAEAGIEAIPDIPPEAALSAKQAAVRDVVANGEPFVSPGLADVLSGFGPPAHYLDFETFSPAIPLYPGTRPYQRIPFQWSAHHLDADGSLSHSEFLADGRNDPRADLAERLLTALEGDDDPILAYNASFEASVIRDLADLLPECGERLLALVPRIRDLLPAVRDNVIHPGFFAKKAMGAGAYSIKTVLPVLVPELSYSDLDGVASGGDASRVFNLVASGEASPEEEAQIRGELFEYCKLDTLAMVELHAVLRSMAEGGDSDT